MLFNYCSQISVLLIAVHCSGCTTLNDIKKLLNAFYYNVRHTYNTVDETGFIERD
jgi:hypothetical protein